MSDQALFVVSLAMHATQEIRATTADEAVFEAIKRYAPVGVVVDDVQVTLGQEES